MVLGRVNWYGMYHQTENWYGIYHQTKKGKAESHGLRNTHGCAYRRILISFDRFKSLDLPASGCLHSVVIMLKGRGQGYEAREHVIWGEHVI